MNKTTFIYGLADPRTGIVRYVGKSNDPKKRLERHLREARAETTCHRHTWLGSLLKNGLRPEIHILEECPYSDWPQRECHWIDHFRKAGHDLVNTSEGGKGNEGYKFSQATRRRLSEMRKGKPKPQAWREQMRLIHKGRRPADSAFAKQGKAFVAISPDGQELPIFNLTRFCRENGLDASNLYKTLSNPKKTCKGWRLKQS